MDIRANLLTRKSRVTTRTLFDRMMISTRSRRLELRSGETLNNFFRRDGK